MQKDNIQNAQKYFDLSLGIKQGLEYLNDTNFSDVENGKYPISEGVYAVVQDYMSKRCEDARFEAHKKYTDIQYIIKGEEKIGYGDVNNYSPSTDYDNEKDIVFLNENESGSEFVELKQNDFAIFTPNDAHKPSVAINSPSYVKKVVVKVLA